MPSKPLTAILSLILPGLGHYHAGCAFRAAFAVTFAWALLRLGLLAFVPRLVSWQLALVLALGAVVVAYVATVLSALALRSRIAGARPSRSAKRYVGFIVATLALAVVFDVLTDATGIRAIKNYHVPAASMEPTIKVGDRVVARLALDPADAVRGDVIVFRYPKDPDIVYVKRVVGLPGDRVKLAQGQLVINDVRQPLTERKEERSILADIGDEAVIKILFEERLGDRAHYILHNEPSARLFSPQDWPANGADFTVPPKSLVVLGDNRDNSTDSRVWGEVPFDHVVGRVEGVLYSRHDGSFRHDRFLQDLR